MRVFLICILAFGVTIFATSKAAADTWVKAETANFIVYSNIGERDANAYAAKLEQYRFILSQFYLSREQQAQASPKFEVYLTDRRRHFKEVWPTIDDDVAGFVVTNCVEGITAFSHFDTDGPSRSSLSALRGENSSLEIIFHEYTHMFMAQNTSMAEPRWYSEGMAEYYSTMKFNNSEMVLGYGSSWRISVLRGGGKLDYEAILRDDPRLREDHHQASFYAQSWLLTNYLLHDNIRQQKIRLYFAARNNGEDPILAFERIFEVKVKDLPHILNRYLESAKTKVFSIRNMPPPQVKIEALPQSSDKLILWNAALKTCRSDDYKPQLLAKIKAEVAKYPEDSFANSVNANADLLIGDEKLALEYFKARSAQNPNDSEAFFRLGQVYFSAANDDNLFDGETKVSQIAKARTAFGRAYQLDPINAANLYYFSKTAAVGEVFPDDSSLNAATEAFLMAPSNRIYALNAAFMLILRDNYEDAKIVLNSISNNPHRRVAFVQAARAIAAIDAKKSKKEIIEALTSGDN